MDNNVKRLEDLKRGMSDLQSASVVAAADARRLTTEINALLVELKETYGCSSFEEAKELLSSMSKEIEEAMDGVEEKLNAIRSK